MTDGTRLPHGRGVGPRGPAAALAAVLCALQALVLVGLAVFYLVELSRGEGSDRARVVSSAVLIVAFAALLAVMAWLWWRGSTWPKTATVVWNALLVAVALLDLLPAGQTTVALLMTVVAVLTIAAALATRRTSRPA